jgi:chromate transporter
MVAMFQPGMPILMVALPFWDTFRRRADAQAIMAGINAAVVGPLGAALLAIGTILFGSSALIFRWQ